MYYTPSNIYRWDKMEMVSKTYPHPITSSKNVCGMKWSRAGEAWRDVFTIYRFVANYIA